MLVRCIVSSSAAGMLTEHIDRKEKETQKVQEEEDQEWNFARN
jgi:hypothetical protein